MEQDILDKISEKPEAFSKMTIGLVSLNYWNRWTYHATLGNRRWIKSFETKEEAFDHRNRMLEAIEKCKALIGTL